MQTLASIVRPIPEQISELRDDCAHSIALRDGHRQLSYKEFDDKAEKFATYLVQLGIGAGDTVAICMERSFDWIVAALGIMRAGAAYVPLDPAWPDSRLRFAVKDAGATGLVAREDLLDRLQCKVHGIDPRRDAAMISAVRKLARGPILPESLAYVIYTSGSTGVPKGVEVTHANLSHLIQWHRDTFRVTKKDRVSHLLGLGFDAAVLEIWGHLCAGSTLCLADDAVRSSPNLIQQWILSERVTISLVPAILGARLIAMEWPETTSLRLLITGGDALQQGPSARLPFEVVNNYGPTECTVVSTWAVLKPGAEGIPPIGHPIAGARVYLLDEEREPVPDGAVGEIYIGGRVVGRGYRNRPELTLRSFLSDPFSGEPYGRMYRTGDRGLRRPDGDIEFRGRLDRQIKIRGQRVELDEIDSVLTRHPSIDFATATIRVSQDGENQLLAYVLPRDHARVPTAHELQELLLLSLPDYMVPATFVRLRALPISPNGKLDLNMLPPPTDAQLLDGITARAPVTPIEEKVLTIVQTLLENDSVSAEDSFFLAGGHSLLGMQLVMRLREELGVNLTLRQLFEAPTVERLAVTIDAILIQKRLASIWGDLLGLGHVGLDDNFFMLGGNDVLAASLLQRIAAETGRTILISDLFRCPTLRQQVELAQGKRKDKAPLPPGVVALQPHGTRNSIFWMHYFSVDLARVIGDDQPLIYVGLTAEDLPALGELPTLQSIAARLVNKILASQPKGPYTLGGWCLGGILSYEIASQLRAAGHEVSLLVLVDPPNPSYVETCNSLDRIVNYMWYVLQRATRLGLMKSFVYFLGHLQKFFSRHIRTKSSRTEMRIAQETIETAALAYQPKNYDGKVLLLLASERPPHVNFLPGWQAVVPHKLQVKYVDAHHRDLLKPENVRSVADAIVSQLTSATEDRSIHCCGDTPRSTGSVQPRNLRTA